LHQGRSQKDAGGSSNLLHCTILFTITIVCRTAYVVLYLEHSIPSFVNSSVHWACFSLNYPIGRLGPAPANRHLLASFQKVVDTKILLFAKSHKRRPSSHIWAPLLPLPRKPLFLSVRSKFTAFAITENSIAIASCITFEMDLPRESSPQEHCRLKRRQQSP
jgi:hypothetical protein